MQDLFAVDVLQAEAELDEPVEDLRLLHQLVLCFCFFYFFLQISVFGIVHDNTDVIIFDKTIVIADHIVMVQSSQNLNLHNTSNK